MAIKNILLPLVGDATPAAIATIEKCVAMAADIGATVAAVAVEAEVALRPTVMIADLAYVGTVETQRESGARDLLAVFNAVSIRRGARHAQVVRRLPQPEIAAHLAACARIADLTLLPTKPHNAQCEEIVEQLLFESGRPVLLCPEPSAERLASTFDRVAIAWDHTAPAARAVADAMPLLQRAAGVRIFTVTDVATPEQLDSGAALVGHLASHGVTASFETVRRDGSSVGKVFGAYVKAHASDLLVMGAYRHSRLNEWIWGGASNTIIGQPPCWVLMSH